MLKHRVLGLGLAVALLVSPARAGELDRYLPADTEIVSVINLKQILGSALVKQVGIDKIRELMKQSDELTDVLKDLKLDPLKDIDRVISAGPGSGEQDKGLMIIHGRFDVEAWRARATKEAKDNKDLVKVHPKVKDGQGGEHTIYELALSDAIPGAPGGLSLFVGIANKNTILAAASKDYLMDGLKVKEDATKGVALKNKAFAEMLGKMDDRQSLSIAVIGDVLTKGQLATAPDAIKDVLKQITAGSGGITVTDGIKVELSVSTKEAADAKNIKETLSNGLNLAVLAAAGLAAQQKELAVLVDFLKSVKVTSRDKIVSLKAELSGEDLGKIIPKDQ